jgi:hypothetical protein
MSKGSSGGGYRSARTGQYVTEKYATSHPKSTVHEAPGVKGSSGPHFRSAETGQYVNNNHGARHPGTTVKNS